MAWGDSDKPLYVQGIASQNLVSALNPDASMFRISAVQIDAGLQHVSAINTVAASFIVSAVVADAGTFHTSALNQDANFMHVSGFSPDMGLFKVSSMLTGNTTGGLTIFRNTNLSSQVAAKATAGSIFGFHAWNIDSKLNYIKFTNTSGAILTGTDAIVMSYTLPASSVRDITMPLGLKGFTTGIGIYSTSAAADNATTGGTASAVGIDLFYI